MRRGWCSTAISLISTQTRDTRLQCGRVPKRTGSELVLGIPVARPSGGFESLRRKRDAASHSLREGGKLRGEKRHTQLGTAEKQHTPQAPQQAGSLLSHSHSPTQQCYTRGAPEHVSHESLHIVQLSLKTVLCSARRYGATLRSSSLPSL